MVLIVDTRTGPERTERTDSLDTMFILYENYKHIIKKIPKEIKDLNLTKFTFETEPELNIIACAIGSVHCTEHFTKIGKSLLSTKKVSIIQYNTLKRAIL